MSYVRVWIHAVFATKHRQPLLTDSFKPRLCRHIEENARQKQLFLDCVNGSRDHLHCLFQLGKTCSVAETLLLIKGESSHWANRELPASERFSWQDDYFAVSVSESRVGQVRAYIHNQEEHHRIVTFEQEAEAFARKFGWDLTYLFKK
jgi:putative transposase